MNNNCDFYLECYGLSGHLTNKNKYFQNENDARIYINENYFGTYLLVKLYKRDLISGCLNSVTL